MINNKIYESLRNKQYNAIINSDEYKILLTEMSKRIIEKSEEAQNEATIENYFDCELFAFFRNIFAPLGFNYNPQKEVSITTKRHITKGRADSVIGCLIIEFKQPSTLSNKTQQEKAIEQICDYMNGITIDTKLIGYITDGTKGCFVYNENRSITTSGFSNLNQVHLDIIIQSIIKLRLTALNSKNLLQNFCNPPKNNGIAFSLVQELYKNLTNNMIPKTKMLFEEWKELFNLSHDDVSKQQAIIDRRKSLESLLNIEFRNVDEEYIALYALQTAYAIIVKIIAYRIISIVRYKQSFINFSSLSTLDSNALRLQLSSLEEGEIFRKYGILNLLEGDFFAWYVSEKQWNNKIANCLSEIFKILTLYTNNAILNEKNKSLDFFKELYQGMIPAAVRHSLGEYYTKHWLAEHVINGAISMIKTKKWKGLDPCCGSGTFLTIMIDKVLKETVRLKNKEQLQEVLSRVKGIDLNPIAVLTARVNYFINIAHLLDNEEELEIPVYLGDASYVPQIEVYDNIKCLKYSINTLLNPINILIPASMVENQFKFSKAMTNIETYIRTLDVSAVYNCLEEIVPTCDLTQKIKYQLKKLAKKLVELEKRNWDGIWSRIITNYLTTANLGKFDIVVGNPPWVDWKSLPSVYRDKIKNLCISRKLFSGDRITGGINLNICALVSNVAAENWLISNGILGFLMPEPLIFQPSYEGFRNFYLSDGSRLYFQKFINWNKAGHPFKPVTQKFLTYYISNKRVDYKKGVKVEYYIAHNKKKCEDLEALNIKKSFNIESGMASSCHDIKNIFSYVKTKSMIENFSYIAGKSEYIGREGIEFYPQEMTIFEESGLPSTNKYISLKNIQVKKSKYKVPQTIELLEKEYLHPLIKGVDIQPFHVNNSNYIVPFPYDIRDKRLPIKLKELTRKAPYLAKFYQKSKSLILQQTSYNKQIIGKKGEFYALARVGAYSFAKHYVCFRDNTKWGAAVISDVKTNWGGIKHPLFQNHAVSICEDSNGNFITLDEAHFICGILNTNISKEYILKSSDSRSFPVRPRIFIPKYDASNKIHLEIAKLSKIAHLKYNDNQVLSKIIQKLDLLYLDIAKNKQ